MLIIVADNRWSRTMNTAKNFLFYLFCTVIPPETHSVLLTSQALSANQHTLYPHITHRLIAD